MTLYTYYCPICNFVKAVIDRKVEVLYIKCDRCGSEKMIKAIKENKNEICPSKSMV